MQGIKPAERIIFIMNKKVLSSLLHYWWVNHFSDSYKITACSVNTTIVAGCFASLIKARTKSRSGGSIRNDRREW